MKLIIWLTGRQKFLSLLHQFIYPECTEWKLIRRTVQRSRAATTTQTAGFQPFFFSTYSKKTRTDDETLDRQCGALLLGDIASKLVSIFLTHKENIWVFEGDRGAFLFVRCSPLDEPPKVKARRMCGGGGEQVKKERTDDEEEERPQCKWSILFSSCCLYERTHTHTVECSIRHTQREQQEQSHTFLFLS